MPNPISHIARKPQRHWLLLTLLLLTGALAQNQNMTVSKLHRRATERQQRIRSIRR